MLSEFSNDWHPNSLAITRSLRRAIESLMFILFGLFAMISDVGPSVR